MIRVAVLDRHPALRAGLAAMLRESPGLAFAGSVGRARELAPLVYRADPDVVIVDDLAARVEGRARVILYAARITPSLVLAASVAGFDGVVDKADNGLVCAIRAVAAGERVVPTVGLREQGHAARRLDPRDRPIFAMRLAGTSPREIASVVGVGVAALNARIAAIVGQLAPAPLLA